MRSELVLRSPSEGTGWEESWAFSGRDEAVLRDCLAKLDTDSTQAPVERWEGLGHVVIEADDRWRAAILLFPEGARGINRRGARDHFQAEAAWTADGARRLAQILPPELDDLRRSIERRFAPADSMDAVA